MKGHPSLPAYTFIWKNEPYEIRKISVSPYAILQADCITDVFLEVLPKSPTSRLPGLGFKAPDELISNCLSKYKGRGLFLYEMKTYDENSKND